IDVHSVYADDEAKLYRMIWKRAIASQMSSAIYLTSKANFSCESYELSASGSSCTFLGWKKCWDYGKSEDYVVPELVVGQELDVIDIKKNKEQTKPPSRFSEASCIKNMKKLGIGRPSTYANTIDTLKSRKYICKEKKSIRVTDVGIRVSEFLKKSDFCFINLDFTANMENDLDKISNSECDKIEVLTEFYERLKQDLKNAQKVRNEEKQTEFKCPKCKEKGIDAYLLKRFSRFGPFLSCENFNNKEIKCEYIANIGENGEPEEKKPKKKKYSDFLCPKCDSKMVIRKSKYGEFLGCDSFPKCKTIMTLDGEVIEKKKKKSKKKSK
ncbi:MAG: DNA topoisomerase, partial [Elusimicrobiota bacterium]